jgi:integrase
MKTHNSHPENCRIYDKYERTRRRKKGTRKKIRYGLRFLEIFLNGRDLKKIKSTDFEGFMLFMQNYEQRGKKLSQNTILNVIGIIYKFFEWLHQIDGYRRCINFEIIDYFRLSNREKSNMRRGNNSKKKKIPTLADMITIVSSIGTDTFSGRRLRAIFSYFILTGARLETVATMLYGLVDLETRIAYHYPSKGVWVKNDAYIETTMPHFEGIFFDVLSDWIAELKTLGFTYYDPLFPKLLVEKKDGYLSYSSTDRPTKQHMTESGLAKIVKDTLCNAGFQEFHCHLFRHAHLFEAFKIAPSYDFNVIKAISANIGHRNLATTIESYANVCSDEINGYILSLKKNDNILSGLPEDDKQHIMWMINKTKSTAEN